MPPVVIIADRRDSGQTLAAVLKERLGITWSQARRVVESRNVRVSGQIVADSTFRVKAGKRISVPPGVVEAKPKTAILETPKVKVKKKKEDPNAAPATRCVDKITVFCAYDLEIASPSSRVYCASRAGSSTGTPSRTM